MDALSGMEHQGRILFVDLGSVTYTSINSVLNTPPNQATIVHDHHLTENIARVGFNYHLGAPVVAKY